MFEETPPETFNVNSLLENSHQIVERSNGPMNHVISKKECKELYPYHDGVDGELFYELIVQFRNRHFAEKLTSLCNCDFSLAQRLGTLCHGNIFMLDRLCFLFSNDLSSALRFLDCFPSSLSSSPPFLQASQFLSRFNDASSATSFLSRFNNVVSSASSFLSRFHNDGSSAVSFLSRFNNDTFSATSFLSRFNNDVSEAIAFLSRFHNDGSSAASFLSRFNNDAFSATSFLSRLNNDVSSASSFLSRFNNDVSEAISFLSRFNKNGSSAASSLSRFKNASEPEIALELTTRVFSDESTFKLALSGCNGDISAVGAFSRLSGIKHLELMYDSELHPRTSIAFHSRCFNQGPTVSFVCSNGKCVCSVVNSSWLFHTSRRYDPNPSAFLLRLSPNPQKVDIHRGTKGQALFQYSTDHGASFELDDSSIFATDLKHQEGTNGLVRAGWVDFIMSFDFPVSNSRSSTTDVEYSPIDRIVVCKYTE